MFRFTIRELLLLTLIVGLGIGWGLDRASYRSAYDALADKLERVTKNRDEQFQLVLQMHHSLQSLGHRQWEAEAERSRQREKAGHYDPVKQD